MRYELWGTPDRTSLTFTGADFVAIHKQQGAIEPDAEFIWCVEADSDNEAMTFYHKHMGWEPYKPMENEYCQHEPNAALFD